MNLRFFLLAISLVANTALGFYWLRQPSTAPAATNRPENITRTVTPASLPSPSGSSAKIDEKTWSNLNAADDAALVTRLRNAGFPPEMAFALVTARLRARYADLFRPLRRPVEYAYWRKNYYEDDSSPETRAARRLLEAELADERRRLLGTDLDLATRFSSGERERVYGNLPAEKADRVGAINRDYNELSTRVREQSQGIMFPEDREQLILLEKEKRADLTAVLTPQELAEYDLRSSPSAIAVRNQLRFFAPTEEEYRTLATIQLNFDQRYGNRYHLSGEQQDQRTAAEGELLTQIKAALPPDRFADYQNKTDQTYGSLSSLLTFYKVTGTTADALVSTQRDLAQRYNTLRQNSSLDPATRDAQLKMLADEAATRLSTALGNDAYNSYKQNAGPLNSLLKRASL